ncbi:MAG: hypothetical protein ACHQAQ_03760 [Hyphomicrobiales bacterium]
MLEGIPLMSDDGQVLDERRKALLAQIKADKEKYLRLARWNYYPAQSLLWASLDAGGLAALLGVVPPLAATVEKWQLGLISALAVALTTFSRQAGFQQKANWHYRKVDGLKALQNRLEYELPVSPTADNIAAVSSAYSKMDSEMTKQWEDMKPEPTGQAP